jgi:hypothetical protein
MFGIALLEKIFDEVKNMKFIVPEQQPSKVNFLEGLYIVLALFVVTIYSGFSWF